MDALDSMNVGHDEHASRTPVDAGYRPCVRINPGSSGKVLLVGAGPGDPDLLTLRAARALGRADAIVYDHLVSDDVLSLARPDARLIYVGKVRDNHTLPQAQINELLATLALSGQVVVRLKGGDPFVFGRGGEEFQALAAAGVVCEVVPGVTAACGIAASTGVPLTHRDYAHSCVFVTGHLRDGSMDLDWDTLARPTQTVVIYMGLKGLGMLARELILHGLTAATPVMVVEKGTLPDQRIVTATLATIAGAVAAERLQSPALTIVGEVVRLRHEVAALLERPSETSATCAA